MTPTHATKSRKRYPYYVTRPKQLHGSRTWRVLAHDLGHLVCSSIAKKFQSQQFLLELVERDVDAQQIQFVVVEADMAAAILRRESAQAKAQLLDAIVMLIRLSEDHIEVELDAKATRERLRISIGPEVGDEALSITVPAVRVCRGHQLRLVLPAPESASSNPASRDEKLIALLAEAHLARQLVMANPAHSLARIAKDNGRCRTRLGKLAAIACLAPDIVTAIVQGKQPVGLNAARLLSCPLPLAWRSSASCWFFPDLSIAVRIFQTRDGRPNVPRSWLGVVRLWLHSRQTRTPEGRRTAPFSSASSATSGL